MPYVGGKMLTVKEAAALLNIPVRRLSRSWDHWGIKAYRVGRELRFRERDLHEWLEGRAIGGSKATWSPPEVDRAFRAPRQPRANCPTCGRSVAKVKGSETLYRHHCVAA